MGDSILKDVLGSLNETGSKSLQDSVILNPEKNEIKDKDDVEVVVRKVVRHDVKDSKSRGEVLIHTENDEVTEGDEVTIDDEPVEDGVYEYEEDGEVKHIAVQDGKVAAIGDENIEDLTKLMIRAGKLIKKKIRTVKKRMTSGQRANLVKARRKAHTSSAKKTRMKSFKKGQMKGLHNATDAEDFFDVQGIDLKKVGQTLYNSVFEYLASRYDLTEKEVDSLDGMLAEEICNPVIDGNKLKVVIPVWTEEDDKVDLSTFDCIELVYDLLGKFDEETLIKGLTEGELGIALSLIV